MNGRTISIDKEGRIERVIVEKLEKTAESGSWWNIDIYNCTDCTRCHFYYDKDDDKYKYGCERRHSIFRPRMCNSFEKKAKLERNLSSFVRQFYIWVRELI